MSWKMAFVSFEAFFAEESDASSSSTFADAVLRFQIRGVLQTMALYQRF